MSVQLSEETADALLEDATEVAQRMHDVWLVSGTHAAPCCAQTAFPPALHSLPLQLLGLLRVEPELRLEPPVDELLPVVQLKQAETVASTLQTFPRPAQTLAPPIAHSLPLHLPRLERKLLRLLPGAEEEPAATQRMHGDTADGWQTLLWAPHTALPPFWHSLPVHWLALLRDRPLRLDPPFEELNAPTHWMQGETLVVWQILPSPLQTALPPIAHSLPPQTPKLDRERLRLLRLCEEELPTVHTKQEDAVGSTAHTLPSPAQTVLPPSAHSSPTHWRLILLRELLRLLPLRDDALPATQRMQEDAAGSTTHTLPNPAQTLSPPFWHSSPPHWLRLVLRFDPWREEEPPATHCMQGLMLV